MFNLRRIPVLRSLNRYFRLKRPFRELFLLSLLCVLGAPIHGSQSQSTEHEKMPDELAYSNYQRAVAYREAGNDKRAWRALELAREQLPRLSLPLTRALLSELSMQLGEKRLQGDLWETYEQVIDFQVQTAGPHAPETLTLRSDYGTELVRKGKFERGHAELAALVELFENPPANVSLDPDPAMVHQVLAYFGMAKIRGGDRANGVKYLERAGNVTPELTQMWERWLTAQTLVELNRDSEALPQFSLLDPFMQESYNFAHPSREKFRKLYAKALKAVGDTEHAAKIAGRLPTLNHNRLPGGPSQRVARGNEPGYTPPVLQEKTHPEFPEEARKARVNGEAAALVLLSADGRVVDAVIKSCQPGGYGFDVALLESIYLWRYTPAELDGVPVAVEIEVSADWTVR